MAVATGDELRELAQLGHGQTWESNGYMLTAAGRGRRCGYRQATSWTSPARC